MKEIKLNKEIVKMLDKGDADAVVDAVIDRMEKIGKPYSADEENQIIEVPDLYYTYEKIVMQIVSKCKNTRERLKNIDFQLFTAFNYVIMCRGECSAINSRGLQDLLNLRELQGLIKIN
jgi:tetrahydromethanopterin S-methyltransferase subunit A